MLSQGQIRLIHTAKDRLGLSSEEYREILELFGGTRSSKLLSPEGFFSVMEHMRELGFEPRGGDASAHQPEPPGRKGALIEMVTPAQRAFIKGLETDLGWADNPERLDRFIYKRLSIRKVRTKADASKVIEALKAMLSRKDVKSAGSV